MPEIPQPENSHFAKPSLIVHGGAGNIADDQIADLQAGCRRALHAGWAVLSGGGAAADAVECAITVFEDDPAFNAGIGAHLNLDGYAQLDAILMDGETLKAGAVAAVTRIRNPIRLARRVLDCSEHMLLVSGGAEQFAGEQGVPLCDPAELITARAREIWERCRAALPATSEPRAENTLGLGGSAAATPGWSSGTVGAVALDRSGKLFAGTSTGGTTCKHAGRVGDSPLVGCGCYADIEAGGASCTGWGEGIMKIVMAKTAVDLMRPGFDAAAHRSWSSPDAADGGGIPPDAAHPGGREAVLRSSPDHAAREAIRLLADRAHGTGGIILLNRSGLPGFAFNTPRMAYGYVAADGSFVVGV